MTPFIGAEKLTSLDGETLVAWQATLSRKGFSNNTRLRSIRILRNALNKAVKLRLIPYNPCAVLDKPKVIRKEVVPLEIDQCQRLIAACQSHRLGDVIVLAAMSGLRKGELFALDWSAVNLSEGVLVVRRTLQELNGLTLKEPKSSAGKRVVSLGREAVEALRSRLRKAKEEGFEPDHVPIVFPDTRGGYPDMLQTLKRDNNPTEKGRLERLNDSHDGPIITGESGQPPKAERMKLIAWWNSLEEIWKSQQSIRTNTAATVAEQYPHGRDATVVPAIGGQVKKRRSPQGGSQPTNDP